MRGHERFNLFSLNNGCSDTSIVQQNMYIAISKFEVDFSSILYFFVTLYLFLGSMIHGIHTP